MREFKQIETGADVAEAVREAFTGNKDAQAGQTRFFRDAVKTKKAKALLCEGLRLLAETPEQRMAKNVEAGPFYMARTILGNQKRMTDPKTGKYAGHFKIDTRKCEKDGDKRLVTAPTLEPKAVQDEAAEPAELTAKDARDQLTKWAKGRGLALMGALLENDAAVLYAAIGDAYEATAEKQRKDEAAAQADAKNEEGAQRKAA